MVPHKKFSKDCSLCHVAKRWDVLRSDFSFNHRKETGYALLGAHEQAACLRCHNDRGPIKAYLSRGCGGCHVDPHKATLGLDCERCHDQTVWTRPGRQGQKVADHARTRFPLTGMHAVIDCRQCHLGADQGDFKALPTNCSACHAREYASAPNHVAKNYSQDCQTCHQPAGWPGAAFNHSGLGPNPNCMACHSKDFQAAPNHVALSFSQNCLSCHAGTTTWLGAAFNHAVLGANPVCATCHAANFAAANATPASRHSANSFPQTCQNCHSFAAWGPATAMQHAFVSAAPCYNCHAADYTSAPNHVAQAFPTTCLNCHTGTATWLGAAFDHAPLGANPVCWGCHQPAYASAQTTPASKHSANSFPQTCQNCHNFVSWGPATAMQHSYVSASPCYNCHAADYTSAPNHVAQAFPTTCLNCHTGTATWLGAVFDHAPLGANPVCWNCHQTVYARAQATPASKHSANSFPQTCQNCHNFAAWGPGTAMQHAFVSATPCYTCHAADYAAANTSLASKHAANSFPTTCANCHNTTAWGPGTAMQHAFASGTCESCHTGDFNAATSPINHTGQGIFASACSTCHTGYATWTGFTHTPSNCNSAPGTGSHHNAKCIQCHSTPVYTTATCTACHRNRGNNCDD